MAKYHAIPNTLCAFDGDIVRLVDRVYDDTIHTHDYHTRFVARPLYYRLDSVSNNGKCRAHDSKGRFRLLHLMDKRITHVYRRDTNAPWAITDAMEGRR